MLAGNGYGKLQLKFWKVECALELEAMNPGSNAWASAGASSHFIKTRRKKEHLEDLKSAYRGLRRFEVGFTKKAIEPAARTSILTLLWDD
jgi:hypothetical protein